MGGLLRERRHRATSSATAAEVGRRRGVSFFICPITLATFATVFSSFLFLPAAKLLRRAPPPPVLLWPVAPALLTQIAC